MRRRIRLTLEYDGGAYAGWQRQQNALSVQQLVEEALHTLTSEDIRLTAASRTDAGVHARGQVVHFDTESAIPPERYHLALNTLLPGDIRAKASAEAKLDFHARFDAAGKRYIYRFATGASAPAIGRQYVWHVPHALDTQAMRAAAAALLGSHDFRACMAAGGTSKTFDRIMWRSEVRREGEYLLFCIEGNGFLYNMVRILAGTLRYVGQGKLPASCIADAIRTGDRLLLGPTAPARGLTLEAVFYGEERGDDGEEREERRRRYFS